MNILERILYVLGIVIGYVAYCVVAVVSTILLLFPIIVGIKYVLFIVDSFVGAYLV